MMIETNIDDMNGEIYGYVMEKAFDQGALEVFFTPIMMKKNRPGTKLSILCRGEKTEALEKLLFEETTTLGIRRYAVDRSVLMRKNIQVKTKYGVVTMKTSFMEGKLLKYAPEYEECKEIAENFKIPIQKVYEDLNYTFEKYIKSFTY